MALPAGAKLPIVLSAVLGACVLGADLFALSGLLHPHGAAGSASGDGRALGVASLLVVSIFVVWAVGYVRCWHFLSRIARESAAMPEAAAKLTELARDVE